MNGNIDNLWWSLRWNNESEYHLLCIWKIRGEYLKVQLNIDTKRDINHIRHGNEKQQQWFLGEFDLPFCNIQSIWKWNKWSWRFSRVCKSYPGNGHDPIGDAHPQDGMAIVRSKMLQVQEYWRKNIMCIYIMYCQDIVSVIILFTVFRCFQFRTRPKASGSSSRFQEGRGNRLRTRQGRGKDKTGTR